MKITKLVAVLCITTQIAACTTLNPVPDAREPGSSSLAVGDEVQVMRTDGSRQHLLLTAVREEEICGKDLCVPRSEISSLMRVEPDTRVRTATVLGVLSVIAGIALVSAIMVAARNAGAAAIWAHSGG